jgi:hypothetical protein
VQVKRRHLNTGYYIIFHLELHMYTEVAYYYQLSIWQKIDTEWTCYHFINRQHAVGYVDQMIAMVEKVYLSKSKGTMIENDSSNSESPSKILLEYKSKSIWF